MSVDAPDGINPQSVTSWLAERVPELAEPLAFEAIPGGRSNLTYFVTDAEERRWVLRRPPLSTVLPSAHDMHREFRIMAALQDTPVPVPSLVGHEPDETVTGAEFFVMDYVAGHVIRDEQAATELLDEPQRTTAGMELADVLAHLHAVDPDAVGLGTLARKQDYVARQLKRMRSQLARGKEAYGARSLPILDEIHQFLEAGIPPQDSATIVHGDYRLDNVIVGDDGRIQSVLDWELATLGDPLADVGLFALYWPETRDEVIPGIATQTVVDGFPSRADALHRYTERTGRDLDRLDYYIAFAAWKLAIILEGVYARFATHAYGDSTDDSWQNLDQVVVDLADRAHAAITS